MGRCMSRWFLMVLCFPMVLKAQSSDSLRTEVALKIVYNGYLVTPIVEVYVNDQKVDAVFDSGSSGLRILRSVYNDKEPDSLKGHIHYGYGFKDSFRICGQVKSASIRIGTLQSAQPIRIMRIDSTKYIPEAEWLSVLDSTRIQSNHFRSYPAIMGVGLRVSGKRDGVANPVAQLPGNGKYIIHFPRFGGSKGKLIINPDASETKDFVLFKLEGGKWLLPNGDSTWKDNELYGCVIVDQGTACQHTLLDTGNPDVHVYSSSFTGNKKVSSGSVVTLQLKDKEGLVAPVQTKFRVGNIKENGKDVVFLDESDGVERNMFGTRFFFDFDVLYDQVNGIIGIKSK
jgi:hypothetical protein